MGIENAPQPEEKMTSEELQSFVDGLDIPMEKKDLTDPLNLVWLNDNVWRNNEVPQKALFALRSLTHESKLRRLKD